MSNGREVAGGDAQGLLEEGSDSLLSADAKGALAAMREGRSAFQFRSPEGAVMPTDSRSGLRPSFASSDDEGSKAAAAGIGQEMPPSRI